jgi:acetolactate decarboxylase
MSAKRRSAPPDSRIYLAAPVNALVEGIYQEKIPLSEIRQHGDFGLGTFEDLDGEMVLLDGRFYRIDSQGKVTVEGDQVQTPFACVTRYYEMSRDHIDTEMAYDAFLKWLNILMPSPNIFYAFRIEGVFSHLKVRSVPRQECYRPLVEVTREQAVFEFKDVEGTLAGFFTPSFMSSLNVPGFHLHFLSTDRQRGGHLLECRPRQVQAGIQFIYHLELSLPQTIDYLTGDFRRDVDRDLDEAEK